MRGDAAPPRGGEFRYDANAQWQQPPLGIGHKDVSAVDVDSRDRVYLLTRYDPNVLVYEPDGTFITVWGGGGFANPHGLTVGPDDSVWTVDNGDHTVRKWTPDGKPLLTLGQPGRPSDTGYASGGPFVIHNVETVARPGEPFNACTNLTVSSAGRVYVADGYGNCRIHAFASDGELLTSWGEPGVGPGEFHLPHGIAVDAGVRVYVCDRENDRIQIFDPGGRYLAEWTDVQRPCQLAFDQAGYCYVAELWRPKGKGSFTHGFMREDHPGRVTIFDRNESVAARWGASTVSRTAPGNFIAPHGIAVDAWREPAASRGVRRCCSEGRWSRRRSRRDCPARCGGWWTTDEAPPARRGELTGFLLRTFEPGDILTHLCTPNAGRVLSAGGDPYPEVAEARTRGVVLDSALGRGNFGIEVARRQADLGLFPDTISSDLTALGQTFHSLLECMAKFLSIGYTLSDVVKATTASAASALGLAGEISAIAVGRDAGLSVIDVVNGDFTFTDTRGQPFAGRYGLAPVRTIKAGQEFSPSWGTHPWGWLPATTPAS